jgi:hypothetical protein
LASFRKSFNNFNEKCVRGSKKGNITEFHLDAAFKLGEDPSEGEGGEKEGERVRDEGNRLDVASKHIVNVFILHLQYNNKK